MFWVWPALIVFSRESIHIHLVLLLPWYRFPIETEGLLARSRGFATAGFMGNDKFGKYLEISSNDRISARQLLGKRIWNMMLYLSIQSASILRERQRYLLHFQCFTQKVDRVEQILRFLRRDIRVKKLVRDFGSVSLIFGEAKVDT